jgi:peptidoglycan DL-endopeptidase CwlO
MSAAGTSAARHRGRRAFAGAALAAAAVLALPAQGALAAPTPGPGGTGQPLEAMLTRLQTLYRKAEAATQDYDDAKDRLGRERRTLGRLTRELDRQRDEVADGRHQVGLLARRQYIDGSLSDYTKLLLSKDPQTAFDQGHILAKAAQDEAGLTTRLRTHEKELGKLVKEQRTTTGRVRTLAKRQREARDRVNRRLDRAEKLVASLTGAQRTELDRLEEHGVDAAQADFLRSGALGETTRGPSSSGRKAVAFAFAHLGDPYVWGAQGPHAFDCSGLTSQAWSHAGRPIPRTSQQQWAQLPHVPLDLLRPGDLVIYFPGATHVAMYIGNGMVVQAPHPGDVVKVSPVAAMPILGAVRPDPYTPSTRASTTPKPPTRPQHRHG